VRFNLNHGAVVVTNPTQENLSFGAATSHDHAGKIVIVGHTVDTDSALESDAQQLHMNSLKAMQVWILLIVFDLLGTIGKTA
jgi:hypothetical protein